MLLKKLLKKRLRQIKRKTKRRIRSMKKKKKKRLSTRRIRSMKKKTQKKESSSTKKILSVSYAMISSELYLFSALTINAAVYIARLA